MWLDNKPQLARENYIRVKEIAVQDLDSAFNPELLEKYIYGLILFDEADSAEEVYEKYSNRLDKESALRIEQDISSFSPEEYFEADDLTKKIRENNKIFPPRDPNEQKK